LTHTGGWEGDSGIASDHGWGDDALARAVDGLKDSPQTAPVGAVWAYNNSGFLLAGRILATVHDKPFERVLRDEIFAPLELKESFYFPWEVFSRKLATGHVSTAKGPVVAHNWGINRGALPAGGIVSSVRDQLKWARLHLGLSDKKLLSPKTITYMQQPQVSAGGFIDAVGTPWLIRDFGGTPVVGHGGNTNNLYLRSFAMVPSRRFAVTVLTNSGSGGALHDEVERFVLDRYLGIRKAAPTKQPIDAKRLRDYVGTYQGWLETYKIIARDGGLTITPRYRLDAIGKLQLSDADRAMVKQAMKMKPQPIQVAFVGDDKFTAGASVMEFLRTKAGRPVTYMRSGGRLMPKL
jgi:CubicO group peptidase (beta-lactamase class C family)